MRIHTLEKLPFGKIDFGADSAETERTQSPHLLLRGFLDSRGHGTRLVNGREYLVLGYKGSGKTALAANIELNAIGRHDLFANTVTLRDFPFAEFARILPTESEADASLPSAWSWLLLIKFFDTLLKDNSIDASPNTEFYAVREMLKSYGLLGGGDLKKLALISTKRELKLKLPFVEGTWAREARDAEVRIPLLADKVKQVLGTLKTAARHILIVDGLDDILKNDSVQFQALSALIFEVSQLNSFFLRADVPLKVLVLCRTDIFDRLSGPNKNKIRQDSAIVLDWYHDPQSPDRSLLVQLANLRAHLASDRIHDVIEEYFPSEIRRKGWSELHGRKRFLLDYTRHLPRDLLRLLHYIGAATAGVQPTVEEVRSGIRTYSIDYFYHEIRDELDGYLTADQASAVLAVLASFGQPLFTLVEFEAAAAAHDVLSNVPSRAALTPLFECSAIANVREVGSRLNYVFKYRNRNMAINLKQTFFIHRGLWKAANIDRH